MKLFENTGVLRGDILNLTPKESLQLVKKGAFIIDLRDPDYLDYKIFDVENMINIPLSVLKDNTDKLPKDKALILADSSGLHSKSGVKALKEEGFENIANMAGGFLEWERDGLPVSIDINERLSGSCACQLKPRERNK